jgi:hypothetical protein
MGIHARLYETVLWLINAICGRMHMMLLSVAHLQLQQLRDMDCVCAVLKESCGMMCTLIASEVGMSAASFAFPLNS